MFERLGASCIPLRKWFCHEYNYGFALLVAELKKTRTSELKMLLSKLQVKVIN